MRRQMVAGNWKMHGSRAVNQALLGELEMSLKPEWPIDIVVFPPYVYLSDAVRMLEGGASPSARRMFAQSRAVRSPARCAVPC
jgi:triosephosphate isomerase